MEDLKAKKRKKKGKEVEELREKGLIPAVIYGPKIKSKKVVVNEKEFLKIFREAGETSLIKLKVEGDKKDHSVLVKDFQFHPVTDRLVHIDFYQPILTEKIEANVPLVFKGEAPAVKEKGGVLVKNINEVEVSALPTDLPSNIEVNIESLKNLDDTLEVGDLDIPEGVRVLRGEDEIVASVSAPKTAEELMEEMERKKEEELFVGEEVPLDEEVEEVEVEEVEEEEEGEQEEIEL